ncbi:MAG: OmpA family protein [Sphingobacterium sp.]
MIKKTIITLAVFQLTGVAGYGQGFLKGLADKASRAGQDLIIKKGSQTVEKAIDSSPQAVKAPSTKTAPAAMAEKEQQKEITSMSKFDFVPGQNTLLADNFEQDVIGEFPLKWFTNGSGEIVKLDGLSGKWLQLNSGSILSPIVKLPDNFTVEFDLFINLNPKSSAVYPGFHFELFDRGDKAKRLDAYNYSLKNILYFKTSFHKDKAVVSLDSRENAKQKLQSDKVFLAGFQQNYGTVVHVALAVQKERLRLWYNDIKALDLPTAVASPANFNQLLFNGPKSKEGYAAFYISNLKIAAGTADMRAKLLETGRFTTNNILFDTGSDKIRPESFGTLKEIATVLNALPEIKIKIVGHTDSDGEAAANLALSRKRAEAIKKVLVEDFQVKSEMLSVDGKGATEPVSSNTTAAGKAENRRVEFIKI